MNEAVFQFFVISITVLIGLFVMHIALSPDFLETGYFFHHLLPEHAKHNNPHNQSATTPRPGVPRLFDHPEPNFQSPAFHWIGEYFSTFTVIPVAGILLLCTAIRYDYPIILCLLYLHIAVMYSGAFASHLTLIPTAFRLTVTGVVWNSLLAFWFLGDLVPVFLSSKNTKDGSITSPPLLMQYPWIRRLLAILGAVVSAATIQLLPEFLGPNGGFVSLSIVQPPFVFLGLVSAIYMKFFASSSSSSSYFFQQYKKCPAVGLVFRGGALLMLAMLFSAIECWVDPVLIPIKIFGTQFVGFPVMHTIIHVVEQIGIYYYGVGAAALHFYYVEGRNSDDYGDGDVTLCVGASAKKYVGGFYLLPYVHIQQNQTQEEILKKVGDKMKMMTTNKSQGQNKTNKKTDKNDSQKSSSSSSSVFDEIDLLSRALRCDPHSFYLSSQTNWIEKFPRKVVVAAHESKIKCIFDPDMIEMILKNDTDYSSNPFGGDESRYIGLSTTSIQLHQQHVSLIAPFFNDQRLRDLAPMFSEIAQKMAAETFSSSNNKTKNNNNNIKDNNLVWYAYRVIIANALALFGMEIDEIFPKNGKNNSNNSGTDFVDFIINCSLDMVSAVAPVGGSGTRRRLTFSSLFRIIKSLIIATPATLYIIFFKLGFSESWKLFRPDTSALLPLIGFDPAGGRNIRSSILDNPEAFIRAPKYFTFLIDELWKKQVEKHSKDGSANNKSIFVSLQNGVDSGKLRLAEGLAIIAQLLIGMTAANGLVSCVKRLMSTEESNLILKSGRLASGAAFENNENLKKYCAPLSDDDILNIFDSENSLNMFINEVLRIDAPLHRMPRRVARDCTLTINNNINNSNNNSTPLTFHFEKDDQLVLMIGCANHNAEKVGPSFIRPYTNEADRNLAAAKSLTFGRGLHRCVGTRLTQMDIECGIEGFLKHFASVKNPKNAGVVVDQGETVCELRKKKLEFELGDMLYDIDVGNYGHRCVKVATVGK